MFMNEQEKKFYTELIQSNLWDYQNGKWDFDNFKNSAYGAAVAEVYEKWYRFEPDSTCEECIDYYKSLGVKRELHDDGGYYDRWSIFYPEILAEGKKYPLVIMHHGVTCSIEYVECCSSYGAMCGKEGFIALYIQNTNVDNVMKILDHVFANYPIDRERVYVSGFSQGGRQTSSMAAEHPEMVTAFAITGNDIFRNGSVAGRIYTDEEFARMKEVFIPAMFLAGQCEYGNLLPLNQWKDPPANRWKDPRLSINQIPGPKRDPRRDAEPDPTIPEGVKRYNPAPPADASQDEKDRWKTEMLNKRLDLLNIEPRDIDKCLSYRNNADTELHKELGFYGDRERIEYHYGYRHYVVEIDNRDGVNAFRYVGIENLPHYVSLMHGPMTWDFFKQFRRDSITGKIVVDPYKN